MNSSVQIQSFPFKKEDVAALRGDARYRPYLDYPVVYILNNERTAYIGETVALQNRMAAHLKDRRRKQLTEVSVLMHERFHKSAVYDIETQLINYFLGDEKYELQNVSQTNKSVMHNYYEKEYYNRDLFEDIWEQLRERGLVDHPLHDIENKDIYKLSPFKALSANQLDLRNAIVDACLTEYEMERDDTYVFLVKGEAGVGKSVVLSATFNKIEELAQDPDSPLYKTENRLLVNHTEMLKTYEDIAGRVKTLKKKQFAKPTSFINTCKKEGTRADIVFVDEAHLLLTRSDRFNSFHENNQLEEIIKHSRVVVIMYDEKQVLRLKSYWDEQQLQNIVAPYRKNEPYVLTDQFRMNAPDAVIEWIDAFVEDRVVLPIPEAGDYDLRVFSDASDMWRTIQKKNKEEGLARVVSTFDFVHKKDGSDYYVESGSFRLPWNRTTKKTWAEEEMTIDEVGSIYTIQGFDLNYVGVILGPSVGYDPSTERLVLRPDAYCDTEAFRGKEGVSNVEYVKEQIILNSINVLMKRGVKGLYVYAHDSALREQLIKMSHRKEKK